MLINPCTEQMTTFPGTRLMQDTLGIIGIAMNDLHEPGRVWTIQSVYAPIPKRMLGGVRVRLLDQKGFITFVNQRDLEVLLGLVQPGAYCHWTGENYLGPDDRDWCGLCVDTEDLLDDLYERELFLRAQTDGSLGHGQEVYRRVHREKGCDEEELLTLLWDADPETGQGPDARLETLDRRWVRIERGKLLWQRVL